MSTFKSADSQKIKIVGETPINQKKVKVDPKSDLSNKATAVQRKNSTKFGAGFRQSVIKRNRETN